MTRGARISLRLASRLVRSVSLAAGIGSLITLGLNAWVADRNDARSKVRDLNNDFAKSLREKQLEQLTAFAFADDEVMQKARDLVGDMLDKKSVTKASELLNEEISKQIRNADKLKGIFDSSDVDKNIDNYQNALQKFANAIEDFRNPGKMRDWKIALGGVVDTKNELKSSLFKVIRQTKQPGQDAG